MTIIIFRSPVTKPLLRAGTLKPVPPDPRAYDTFRVTQRFDSIDAFHQDGRRHNATDIGNFRCGDPIVAMAAGTVRRVQDNAKALGALTNALGVIVDHGNGISTEYWHLNAYAGPSSGPVAAGQQVGIVGRTGLGNVCHCHIEAKRNGVKFDPEPLMFGGSVTVEDDDMKLRPVQEDWNTIAGADFYLDGPEVGTAKRFTTSVRVRSIAESVEPAGNTWRLIAYSSGEVLWIQRSNLRPITGTRNPATGYGPPTAADCRVQEATISQQRTALKQAGISLDGSIQATEAALTAQRTARERVRT